MLKLGLFTLSVFLGSAWGADPKVRLRQTFPYTTIVDNYKTVVVEKDHDCYMACVVDNKPAEKKVQWLVQNFEMDIAIPISTDTDTQNAFKYQIDKPAANNWRLKIQNVQQSDQALYICRVQLGGQQNANDSRMIQVIQKPQIVDIFTSSDTTKQEGDSVELKCAASGIPKPLITWEMSGGGLLPTGGRELSAPMVVIDSATRDHRGDYKCIAQNIAGKDVRRIYLDVKFQPELLVDADRREVLQAPGYNRELTCVAKGNPVPTEQEIMWFKDGTPLEGSRFVRSNFFGSNYALMKLLVKDISESDYGEYRCYAENTEGNGENSVILSRSSEPVAERQTLSGASNALVFSLTTLVMLLATALLHCC